MIQFTATYTPHADRVLVPRAVCIAPEPLAVLLQHVQADGANESGGILLGRYLTTGGIAIDEVTTPGPGDVGAPRSFHRDGAHHNAAILDAWKRSGGTCHYLGNWHTHSEPLPIPSQLDVSEWTRDVSEIRAQHDEPNLPLVYLIVGQSHIGTFVTGDPTSREAA